ncbi:methanethiol S-methyltransferase [Mycobacterium camsae]|uniref:methanethiol S-methyltransferase n=1 Tax=Mycobacterium gordonae TaxID=1778 RepID=UPI00197E0C44|nr:methanethiol S-methyltransferase [Mycobacterium gordonae]
MTADAGTPLRLVGLVYGALSYVAFLGAFGYLVGFVVDVAVPRSVDRALKDPPVQAMAIDLGLLLLFALQHSVMARPAFKRWWTRFVPEPVERSTYVLVSSAALALLYWQWRSIDITVWQLDSTPARTAVYAVGALGWLIALTSTFMIDHFELFGLRQVLHNLSSKPHVQKGFRAVLLYRLVRHPLMLGFLLAFWAAPTMTTGHALFAAAFTVYILIALQFEERDLVAALGEQYRRYQARVPMLLPRGWRLAWAVWRSDKAATK